MSTIPVTLLFSDGVTRCVQAEPGQSVLDAAAQAGLHLLSDCSNGQCGTCACQLVSGELELDDYDPAVLPDSDRDDGMVLTCVSRVTAPCAIELPYEAAEAMAEESPPLPGTVVDVTQVAEETYRLTVDIDVALDFQPGQYVRIRPAGSDTWRSYSMANQPGDSRLVFYIRVVPDGVFSTWLTGQAAPGSAVELSEPHGAFFLRSEARPRLFIAGGTGLAPFLSMLDRLADSDAERRIPTALLLGVRTGAHLFARDEIERIRARWPELQVRYATESAPLDACHTGYATDLIASLGLDRSTRAYLCGPPPMVEAGRTAAEAAGLARRDMLCERFN